MNIEEAKRIALADIKHEARCEAHRRAEPQRKAVFAWMDSMTPEESLEWAEFHSKIRVVLLANIESNDADLLCAELDAAFDEALAEPAKAQDPPTKEDGEDEEEPATWPHRAMGRGPRIDPEPRWTSKSALTADPRERFGWHTLVQWLKESTHEGEKSTAAVFSPFAGDHASCIVLDHDHVSGFAFAEHLMDLQARAVDAVVYTTHSHGKILGSGSADFRTVVRLSRPADLDEYKALCHYFDSHFRVRADHRAVGRSSVFFAPSYPPERKDSHMFRVFSGQPYDVDAHFEGADGGL